MFTRIAGSALSVALHATDEATRSHRISIGEAPAGDRRRALRRCATKWRFLLGAIACLSVFAFSARVEVGGVALYAALIFISLQFDEAAGGL